jgi:hypothetical protein
VGAAASAAGLEDNLVAYHGCVFLAKLSGMSADFPFYSHCHFLLCQRRKNQAGQVSDVRVAEIRASAPRTCHCGWRVRIGGIRHWNAYNLLDFSLPTIK